MNLRTLVALGLVAASASLMIPAATAACVPVNAGSTFTGLVCASTRTDNLVAGGWRSDVIGPGAFFVPNEIPETTCHYVDQGATFRGGVCYRRETGTIAGGWRSNVIGPGAIYSPDTLP